MSFHWLNDSWTRGFELATRGFELVTRKVELVTHELELVDLNSHFRVKLLVFLSFQLVTCNSYIYVTRNFYHITYVFSYLLSVL